MQKFFARLDDLAQINRENKTVRWLERLAFIFLTLMILCAPHSIAASQTAWLCGMAAWAIRLLFKPRPPFFKTPLNVALLAFFGWALVAAVCSYAPDISLDRLRSVSLLLIFFFVVNNLRNRRAAVFLALALVGSTFVGAAWTPLERIWGRGVEVYGVRADGALAKANLKPQPTNVNYIRDGDTIIKIGRKKIFTPEALVAEIEKADVTPVTVYRPDYDYVLEVKRADLLNAETALGRLGVERWRHSRSWRSAGFYGHYTTYAEVLQLVGALTLGILVVLFGQKSANKKEKRLKIILGVCLAAFALALLLTVTRASQAGFIVSAGVIVALAARRKVFFVLIAAALPLALIGLLILQQSRGVGFFDSADNSITWRQTVYREGLDLAIGSLRHLLVGVGMDSIKRYAKEWHLFDDGKLPMGHFHSTPLQLAVERGLPALLIWLWVLLVYAKTLWHGFRSAIRDPQSAIESGIILGCLGGLFGFSASGLVHYNLGDGEVAMVFYTLMGISVFLAKGAGSATADRAI